jgi:hypothetical protein
VKASASRDVAFNPIRVTMVLECQSEVDKLLALCLHTKTEKFLGGEFAGALRSALQDHGTADRQWTRIIDCLKS